VQLAIDKLTSNSGLGETYPHNITNNARASSAKMRPAKGAVAGVTYSNPGNYTGGRLAEYQHAHVTITYRTPGRNTDQQPENSTYLINETLESHAEFLSNSNDNLTWSDGTPLDIGEAPGIMLRSLDYCVVFQSISVLPAALLTLPGCVNSGSITSPILGLTFDPETLMFGDPALTRKYDIATGSGIWTVNLRFHYRAQGWNKFPRKTTVTSGTFETIQCNGSDWKPYQSASFTPLLAWAP
jgi:hypothetical protein